MQLAAQLLSSLLLAVACILIHGTGVAWMGKLLSYEEHAVRRQRLAAREVRLMVPMALCLFALHVAEILLFALFYWMVGAMHRFDDALFFSTSAYATLGQPEAMPDSWRLVGAFEGLIGFLLIGWSAAMFVTDMEKVLRKRFD